MGWLRLVGSIKLQVSFAESSLFYRALLQKRPIILSILLTKATPYLGNSKVVVTHDKNKKEIVHCGTKDLRACWQLTATCARPFDARITTATLLFIGVLFCCAPRPRISRTLAELHWIRRRRPHDRPADCSSAARDQRQAL